MSLSINTDVLVGSGLSGATAAITAADEARESIGTHYLLEDKE